MRPGHKKRPADTENALVAGLITLMNTSIGATDSVFQHRCTFGETKEQLKRMCQLVCGHPVLKDAWNEIQLIINQGTFHSGPNGTATLSNPTLQHLPNRDLIVDAINPPTNIDVRPMHGIPSESNTVKQQLSGALGGTVGSDVSVPGSEFGHDVDPIEVIALQTLQHTVYPEQILPPAPVTRPVPRKKRAPYTPTRGPKRKKGKAQGQPSPRSQLHLALASTVQVPSYSMCELYGTAFSVNR